MKVNRPIPEHVQSSSSTSHEDTLLLLDLVMERRRTDGLKKRVSHQPGPLTLCQEAMIRAMGLEKKREGPAAHLATRLSWNCKTAASTTGGI